MKILTVSEVRRICKQMFGPASVIANESCGYSTNSGVYLCAAGSWFKVNTKTWAGTPINNNEIMSILGSIIIAKERNMLSEVCDSYLDEGSGSDAIDFQNALKEWDLI